VTPYLIYAKIAGALALAAALVFGGWHARAVIAERDALTELAKAQADTAKRADALIKAQEGAEERAREYDRKAQALQPVVRLLKVQADPIIREIEKCPLPPAAGDLLTRAADTAEK